MTQSWNKVVARHRVIIWKHEMNQRTTKLTIRQGTSDNSAQPDQSLACAFYSLWAIQKGINENPCHTVGMHRLIWVFVGHTGLIVDFVFFWLINVNTQLNLKQNEQAKRELRKEEALQQKHYENTPIQIYWKFYHQKKWKFSDKNSDNFHISAQKHRLWVLVRTASARQF